MKKILSRNISLTLLILLVSSVIVQACYFPRGDYWVRPGQQRAVIFFEDNTQTMVLSEGFVGNAKDLVWIIPSPTKPEVIKSKESVLTNVANLARQKYYSKIGYMELTSSISGNMMDKGVVLIESKQVDYYDVDILLATNSQDLIDWFHENDYIYPQEYSHVLNYYISKGWYFTAIKVSPDAQKATDVMQDLKEGNPTPIKMTFLTDKIVYPLKISSVEFPPKIKFAKDEPINSIRTVNNQFYTKLETNQWKGDDRYSNILTYTDNQIDLLPGGASYIINQRSNNNNQINLYVFADNKYQGDNFNINYGNWVRKSEIKDLGYDDEGNSYFSPKKDKYYLTHLSSYLQKSQMDEDLVLRKSIDNKKVNAGPETYQLFLYGLLIGIGAIIIWVFTPLGWASIA